MYVCMCIFDGEERASSRDWHMCNWRSVPHWIFFTLFFIRFRTMWLTSAVSWAAVTRGISARVHKCRINPRQRRPPLPSSSHRKHQTHLRSFLQVVDAWSMPARRFGETNGEHLALCLQISLVRTILRIQNSWKTSARRWWAISIRKCSRRTMLWGKVSIRSTWTACKCSPILRWSYRIPAPKPTLG